MQSLDSLKKLIEWMLSAFCLVGTAALLLQGDWISATAIFAFGFGINPLVQANNIVKACLTLIAFIVIFGR